MTVHANEVLLDQKEFIERAFEDSDKPIEMKSLWANKELKQRIQDKLAYTLHGLRLRYWSVAERTAWVLEEVGKERPITIGVVVEDNTLIEVKILVYRESRGGEVRHDFFTQQFSGAILLEDPHRLAIDKRIDGITGATLSVRAVTKVATLALFLHEQVIPSLNDTQKSQ